MTWRARETWSPEPPTADLELMLSGDRWAEVRITYRTGAAARTSGPPDDWHPAEPGWFEVTDCTLHDDEHPEAEATLMGARLERWAAEHHEAIGDLAVARLGLVL